MGKAGESNQAHVTNTRVKGTAATEWELLESYVSGQNSLNYKNQHHGGTRRASVLSPGSFITRQDLLACYASSMGLKFLIVRRSIDKNSLSLHISFQP